VDGSPPQRRNIFPGLYLTRVLYIVVALRAISYEYTMFFLLIVSMSCKICRCSKRFRCKNTRTILARVDTFPLVTESKAPIAITRLSSFLAPISVHVGPSKMKSLLKCSALMSCMQECAHVCCMKTLSSCILLMVITSFNISYAIFGNFSIYLVTQINSCNFA
jgi:hypothetical protein